jgi:DNA-binding transcriptional ArsR family regulator
MRNEVWLRRASYNSDMRGSTKLRLRNEGCAEEHGEWGMSRVAAAIGEPARARMLCCLMDGRARTSTELAMVAGVSPSTASVHLQKLSEQRLVRVTSQGKHRYYALEGPRVARLLEGLSVIAGDGAKSAGFVPNTPDYLRVARTCYDHIAGMLGVALHDRMGAMGWIASRNGDGASGGTGYELTHAGEVALEAMGAHVKRTRELRRRFAYGCLDWSERRPHIGGALGAVLLGIALKKKWVVQDLDSRALEVTAAGRREMMARFGVKNWNR